MTVPGAICCWLRAVKSCQRLAGIGMSFDMSFLCRVFRRVRGGAAREIAWDIQIPDSEHFPYLLPVVLLGLLQSPITCMKFLFGADLFCDACPGSGIQTDADDSATENNSGLRR